MREFPTEIIHQVLRDAVLPPHMANCDCFSLLSHLFEAQCCLVSDHIHIIDSCPDTHAPLDQAITFVESIRTSLQTAWSLCRISKAVRAFVLGTLIRDLATCFSGKIDEDRFRQYTPAPQAADRGLGRIWMRAATLTSPAFCMCVRPFTACPLSCGSPFWPNSVTGLSPYQLAVHEISAASTALFKVAQDYLELQPETPKEAEQPKQSQYNAEGDFAQLYLESTLPPETGLPVDSGLDARRPVGIFATQTGQVARRRVQRRWEIHGFLGSTAECNRQHEMARLFYNSIDPNTTVMPPKGNLLQRLLDLRHEHDDSSIGVN